MSAPTVPSFGPRALIGAFGGGLPPNFWKLWTSSVAANLADGIVVISIPLIAVSLTTSPAEVAGVTVAARIPNVAVSLLAGGLADRIDRRRTMVAVQVLRFVIIGVLAGLAFGGTLTMPMLYAAAFLIGTGEAFFDTSAAAIIPSIVGRDRLVTANGRLFAAETLMNSFVGPPVGGLLVAISVPVALSAGAVGFALAAVGLLLIVGDFRAERTAPPRRLHHEIAEGIAYLARHPLLRTLSVMVAMGRVASGGFFALLALYAVAGPMGLSEAAFGLLFVASGIGSLIGSIIATRAVAALGRPTILAGAQFLFGISVLLPALTADALIIAAGFFIGGVAVMAWNITNVSLRQSILPESLLGRVQATHRTLANLAEVLGAFAAGLIAEAFGLQVAFAVAAAVVFVSIAGRLVVTDQRIRAAEAEAVAEPGY